MSIGQEGIHIGVFYIRFYALALLSGIIAAAVLIDRRVKQHGENPDYLWDGLVWVVLAGIVGARLYHVLTPPPSMNITPWEYLTATVPVRLFGHTFDFPAALAIWQGGLGLPGGLIGGGLAAWLYARRHRLDFWVWADLIIPAVPLGQAIGRLGNFFNQELYGRPSNLPWAIPIRPEKRVAGYKQYTHFHPMFLYEMLMDLAICGGLIWLGDRFADRLRRGDLLAFYGLFYFGGRFFLEFLKLDAPALGSGLTVAQIVSLIAVAGCLAFLFARHRWTTR